MNLTFVSHNQAHNRLLLIMAGWGMDAAPFGSLVLDGYDIAVTWDYRDETLDAAPLRRYREVVVIAWSMGVMECERVLPSVGLPVTLMVAVNGTATPVSDTCGIPCAIFDGTLAALSEAGVARFNRRMCGSATAWRAFADRAPHRTLDSLRDELRLLGERALTMNGGSHTVRWDMAVIGSADLIFPPGNMAAAWQGVRVLNTADPHLPDFQALIDRLVVDKQRVSRQFGSTRPGYDREAATQNDVALRLAGLILEHAPQPLEMAVEIGAGSGRLTLQYAPLLDIGRLELWDIAPADGLDALPDYCVPVVDDAETRLIETPDASVNLIVSASTMQWFNSPVRAIGHLCRVLRPGGLAALSLYVDGTYSSLARATGISINYVTPAELLAAATPDCKVLYSSLDSHVETYPSTRALIDHTRRTGVNAVGHTSTAMMRRLLTDDTLRQLEYNTFTLLITRI